MANQHQGFGCSDLPYPAPQVSFPAVLLDAPDHLEERLLQHILGVLGAAQHAEREIVHGRLERPVRSEEHTSELQSRVDLVCRLLLEKKKKKKKEAYTIRT